MIGFLKLTFIFFIEGMKKVFKKEILPTGFKFVYGDPYSFDIIEGRVNK